MMAQELTWLSWWDDADTVVRSVFVLLVALSLIAWSVIAYKAVYLIRAGRYERLAAGLLAGDASSTQVTEAIPNTTPTGYLLVEASVPGGNLEARLGHLIRECRLEMESGLTLLASIGNAAPFIGLFGTVWGIMHALQALDSDAAVSLEMVAGPVAEALVATAAGLFAAIPAVVGYNLLLRLLRRVSGATEGNALRILTRSKVA